MLQSKRVRQTWPIDGEIRQYYQFDTRKGLLWHVARASSRSEATRWLGCWESTRGWSRGRLKGVLRMNDKLERSRKTSWLYGSDVRPSRFLLTEYEVNSTSADNLSSAQPYSRPTTHRRRRRTRHRRGRRHFSGRLAFRIVSPRKIHSRE